MLEFDYTILIQFANFLILLIVLNFLLFKPVLRVLKKRQDVIHSLWQRVQFVKDEADGLGRAYDDGSKERRRPVLEQKDSALKEANAASMKVIEEARAELTGELAKIRVSVRQEADRTLASLKGDVDRLSMEIVKKVLRRGS